MTAILPNIVLDAFEKLVTSGMATITRDLAICSVSGGGQCGLLLRVPQPNPLGLPAYAAFDLRIPTDPHGRVSLTATDRTFQGFAHQAIDGTLCLKPEKAFTSFADRVLAYVNDGIDWLIDAANDRLLELEQPWELPDFRMTSEASPLLFLESEDTFTRWRHRVGQHGRVDLADHVQARGIVATRFLHRGEPLVVTTVTPSFCTTTRTSPASWMLLDSFIVEKHRRPVIFAELEQLAKRVGIDIWQSIRGAVKSPSIDGYRYLLVGAPIPRRVGHQPVEIHWQPIAFSATLARELLSGWTIRDGATRRQRIAAMIRDRDIPWTAGTNVSTERLLVRGALAVNVRKKRICLIGCGAIGSLLAEYLARGGAHDLALFDEESLEFGNLGRHALHPMDVGNNKAIALAHRLSGFFPDAKISGYPFSVPPPDIAFTQDARTAIEQAEVIIDCTANERVLHWASDAGRRQRALVVHVYANAGATMLTITSSGMHASCIKVDTLLHADVVSGRTPFSMAEYDPDIPEIEPGAGCWSPTFPARGNDLASLVALGVTAIEQLVSRDRQSRGRALVIRRHEIDSNVRSQVLVETAWSSEYR